MQKQLSWEYARNEQIKQLTLYGRKYTQYLNGECPLTIVQKYKIQSSLLKPELWCIVELLAELDTLTRLKRQKQDYCSFSLKVKHLYDAKFLYINSFRPMQNHLPIFIHWFYQCLTNFHNITNINRKTSLLLGFNLAINLYVNSFQIKKSLH